MKVLRTVSELRAWRRLQPSLGFVPTMGALHEGHLNLLSRSLKENHSTLLSIFVNPSQFAPTEDLDTYPRTFDSDLTKFHERSLDVYGDRETAQSRIAVFAPTVREMYPRGIELEVSKQKGTFVEVLGSSHQLEGAARPQFFRGVATVVTKLLNAVQPTAAYFGQKDVQQTVVVRNLVRDLLIDTDIRICETARESNGLAMSSRNAYLTPEERAEAAVIYRALTAAQTAFKTEENMKAADLVRIVASQLKESSIIEKVEYVSVNDLDSFDAVDVPQHERSVICTAVRLNSGVRLLDNIVL